MNKTVLTFAVLAASIRLALAADSAALSVVVFDQGRPVPRTEVWIDGNVQGRTNHDGSVVLSVPAGSRELILRSDGRDVLRLELDFAEGERAELIASLQGGSPAHVQYESSEAGQPVPTEAEATQHPAGPPGTVSGLVVSSEGGVPVANARVFISGTALDIRTDTDGRFSAELAPGSYSLSVIAANYDTRSFDGIAIESEQTVSRQIELTPAGIELPEFVVLEPYVEGSLASLVEERRESAQVLELLGAEQISRAGDSDAAAALRRVTGLTLIDGKFIFVRGLGERYSSTLLNGAQVPSPDPTRRVVPLDLFPTEVLEGIGVQKTYSADMPGEFGGGTVQLRTKSFPKSLQAKVAASLAYAEGTTGTNGLSYAGGSRDWLGRDDGTRAFPDALLVGRFADNPPDERVRLANELAAKGYNQYERKLDPNASLSLGVGDSFGDDVFRFGYNASLRHSHQWDQREDDFIKVSIDSNTGELYDQPTEVFSRTRTERSIDSSAYLTVGAELLEHHSINAGLLMLRQTSDDTRVDEGYEAAPGDLIQKYSLEWVENELRSRQFSGKHSFPQWRDLALDWQYTRTNASRFEPNTRSYRYEQRPGQGWGLVRGSNGNNQRSAQLDDASEEATIGVSMPFEFGTHWSLRLSAGYGLLERDRESSIRRYRFQIGNSTELRALNEIEEIFSPPYIGLDPRFVTLSDAFQPTDVYTAEQRLDSRYLMADLLHGDRYRLNIGVRQEDNDLTVSTLQPFNPIATPDIGAINESDRLPAATFTWSYSDRAQVRAAFSRTLSRPDFRELTRSPFTDPLTDVTTQGNPELIQAQISNYDLRWEYYFSDTELLSFAAFLKEFADPIEIVRVPGTGELLEPRNAEAATNYGFEIDYYKSLGDLRNWQWFDRSWAGRLPWEDVYIGFNYARIRSEVTLGDGIIGIQTTDNRPLQGQSPYVFNFQVGYQHPDGRLEATLLYNVIGERIVGVGVRDLPDVYELPLHQLDFVYGQKFADNWKFKLRLRNLLGEAVEFSQGGRLTRSYDKGRDITLSLEWSW